MKTITQPIHPAHVAENLWADTLDPSRAADAEDRAYRFESVAVLLKTLRADPWTIINALEAHCALFAETEDVCVECLQVRGEEHRIERNFERIDGRDQLVPRCPNCGTEGI